MSGAADPAGLAARLGVDVDPGLLLLMTRLPLSERGQPEIPGGIEGGEHEVVGGLGQWHDDSEIGDRRPVDGVADAVDGDFGDAELASLIAPRPLVLRHAHYPDYQVSRSGAPGQRAVAAPERRRSVRARRASTRPE